MAAAKARLFALQEEHIAMVKAAAETNENIAAQLLVPRLAAEVENPAEIVVEAETKPKELPASMEKEDEKKDESKEDKKEESTQ